VKDIAICVCGNKVMNHITGHLNSGQTDLSGRVVTEKEARSWAQSHNFMYMEASASSGDNVKEMFNALFASVLAKMLVK